MSTEKFIFNNKTIAIEEKKELDSSYKIKSYKKKMEMIEKKKIPQKEILEVINHLFTKNPFLSKKTKNSVSKIIYSKEDSIIIAITNHGKEFIWNRDKFIREYGWFFFVSETEDGSAPKKKAKKVNKEEVTVSTNEYEFKDNKILLKQKENMRGLYKTKEYFKYFKLVNSKKIPQKPIKEVLDEFFADDKILEKEKLTVQRINYYIDEKVIVIKSIIGDKMYENLEWLVKQHGWYFYITGVPVGDSAISLAIDKIERRFNADYFKNISLNDHSESEKIRVSIYPLVLRPNHNCIILGLGEITILLDCGIDLEHYSRYIEDYLAYLPQYIKDAEGGVGIDESENENETIAFTPKLDAIFISHSHFDHISGLKDLIKKYPDIPILCSRITLDLYLLRDSEFLKQYSHDIIEDEEYQKVIRNVIYVENGDKMEFKNRNCFLSFFHAGHMPGALMLMAKINDFRFLYTGDYTYYDITPFAGTQRFLEQISRPLDFLLIDASCAYEEFGDPSHQFQDLILFLEQKAEYGDNCLIGADPSSLAVSFMLIFWRHFRKLQLKKGYEKRPNIYVDQMVRKNIQVLNHRYEYIYGPISRLIRDKANPFNSIKIRWFDLEDLEFLRKKNNIIISHPPDLSYGIIRNIINVIGRNSHNIVYLSGAIHEQPGLDLIGGADEISFSETWKVPIRALLLNTFAPQLKIKLHGDKKQLTEMIKNLEPKEVCFFHQSPVKLYEVVEYVKDLGVEKVSVPQKRKFIVLN
ncbi:MAG: MBL fold metallo-hydrolase [Candidatus Hodarchaeota archaeon]